MKRHKPGSGSGRKQSRVKPKSQTRRRATKPRCAPATIPIRNRRLLRQLERDLKPFQTMIALSRKASKDARSAVKDARGARLSRIKSESEVDA